MANFELEFIPIERPTNTVAYQVQSTDDHQHYSFGKAPLIHRPFIVADIHWVNGMMEGLSAFPISGVITISQHEGLISFTGQIELPDPHTRQMIDLILCQVNARLAGLVDTYPSFEYRHSFKYVLEWRYGNQANDN